MISVVMPSYNSAAFVAEAIESVLAQTFPDFELLVCDDGSTDGTQEIVQGYARHDGRIRFLQHGFRSVSRNCNAALEAARHGWIARLDADDVMHRHRLERQIMAVADDPSVVLWGGFARLINRHGQILRTAMAGPTTEAAFQASRRAGRMVVILGPTVMFRRSLALELGGYDPRFDSAEDLELLHRMAGHGSVRALPRMLTRYRIHGGSITASTAIRQARLLRYIELRERARAEGQPPPTLEAFLEALDRAPLPGRLGEWLDGRSRQCYRNATVCHAERHPVRTAAWAASAATLNPTFTLRRIGRRVGRSLRRRIAAMPHGLTPHPGATDEGSCPYS
jgi:glycosyltransferase involved in cell wall biosynthesis